MKLPSVAGIVLLLVCACGFGQDTHPGGIVYGPKAAFTISAPAGWVLDNSSGVKQGLPCVLYPKDSSWSDARTIMYAEIASTQFTDVEAFVAKAIKEMQKTHGTPKQKIESGKTSDGHPFLLTNTRRRNPILSGSELRTFNYPARLRISYCQAGTNRAIAKTRPHYAKF